MIPANYIVSVFQTKKMDTQLTILKSKLKHSIHQGPYCQDACKLTLLCNIKKAAF